MTARTWFITGASGGIGRAVTEELLGRGFRVAAVARRSDRLSDLTTRYGDQLWTASVDVTDTPRLRQAVHEAIAALGAINVVLSGAGRGAFGAAEELSDEAIDEQIALNLVAPIQLTRAVLPQLRAQGGGRIIAVSTMGGQITTPGASLYHASKWGLEGFFETLIDEISPLGIDVTIVEPGGVRTDFLGSVAVAEPIDAYEQTPVGVVRRALAGESDGDFTGFGVGDPHRVANAIIALAESNIAPRRLVLGSDACEAIRAALARRSAELEVDKQAAASTDFVSA